MRVNGWVNTYNGESFKAWNKGDNFLWIERHYQEGFEVTVETSNEPLSYKSLGIFTDKEAQDVAKKYMEEN